MANSKDNSFPKTISQARVSLDEDDSINDQVTFRAMNKAISETTSLPPSGHSSRLGDGPIDMPCAAIAPSSFGNVSRSMLVEIERSKPKVEKIETLISFRTPSIVRPRSRINVTDMSTNKLVQRVDSCLKHLNLDFEFYESEAKWNVRRVTSSSVADIEIFGVVEADGSISLDLNRLDGDSLLFRDTVSSLSGLITPSKQSNGSSICFCAPPMEDEDVIISDDLITSTLDTAESLLRSNLINEKIIGAQMSSSLSQVPIYQAKMAHLVTVLASVVSCSSDSARLFAILTLANLSVDVGGVAAISANVMLLKNLLAMVCEGGYKEAQMRREAARIVANIAESNSSSVFAHFLSAEVEEWRLKIDNIRDEKLMTHVQRARGKIAIC